MYSDSMGPSFAVTVAVDSSVEYKTDILAKAAVSDIFRGPVVNDTGESAQR